MPRYRLLALDIDGTLVNSRDELTPGTRAALRQAIESGIRVVLATGRRYSRALPLVAPLGLDVPLVTASGALIKDPLDHRTLYRADFNPGVLTGLLPLVLEAGYEPVLYGDSYGQGFEYYCRSLEGARPELAEFYALNAGCHRLCPELIESPPQGIFACFAIGPRPEMLSLCQRLEARYPTDLYVHVLRSPRYAGFMCEISPFGVTKWSGIQHLACEWGIADAEICAVGDDVNDIPMIRAAGLGVAMGNALDEVKAAADRIAPCHDEEGVVQIVDWLLAAR